MTIYLLEQLNEIVIHFNASRYRKTSGVY